MRTISEHLKSKNFSHVYLLYGPERYLVRFYKNALIKSLIPADDTMNINYFSGSNIEESQILQAADTLPFFSERRVIVINESDFINRSTEGLADLIDNIPDYLYMVFVEKNVKKNLKLFKRIQKNGVVEEFETPKGKELESWAIRIIKRQEMNITKNAWELLRDTSSDSLDHMVNEMDKVIDYCRQKGVIEEEDVKKIISPTLEEKIFELIDGIAEKNTRKVMTTYHDMKLLKTDVNMMLATMYTQFSKMLMVKGMIEKNKRDDEISKELGMHPFFVKKSRSFSRRFEESELRHLISDICDLEGGIRTGRVSDTIGFEALIMKYTTA